MSASRRWSDSECVVLVALYMCSDFAIADDERAENALIASDLSRNPSSVDRQWRNIKDYLNRIEGKNISNTLKHFCDAAVEDVESVTGLALYFCGLSGWEHIGKILDERTEQET